MNTSGAVESAPLPLTAHAGGLSHLNLKPTTSAPDAWRHPTPAVASLAREAWSLVP